MTTMNSVETSTDKRLERVRKLLALAENSAATAAEAESFTAKAAELIAEYGIDEALLSAAAPEKSHIERKVMTFHAPYADQKASLAYNVGLILGVKGVANAARDSSGKKIVHFHMFGQHADIVRVDMLVTSLMMQAARDVMRTGIPWGEDKAAYRRSWWLGFTSAIAGRLRTAEREARLQAEDRFAAVGTSSALVVRDRDTQAEEAMREAFPNLTVRRSRTSGSGAGAGHAAGQRANLGGKQFAGRGQALSR